MSESVIERPGVETATGTSPKPRGERGRLAVLKTYKLYVGGAFPRTESGRYDPVLSADGRVVANACRASRKDFREAVVAARGAWAGWAGRTAFNRGQILYRIAEMLEGRVAQLVAELEEQGLDSAEAREETLAAVDRLVHYAGWCDKYQQIFSSVNPVSSSHFNFSIVEPTGVVGILAPEESPLLGLVSVIAPVIAGGNTAIVLASGPQRLSAITLAEVLHVSDLPAGVVNLLTGRREELLEHFASHRDVNAVVCCGDDVAERASVETGAAGNLKRVIFHDRRDWRSADAQDPYAILACQEVKTTWHPIGR